MNVSNPISISFMMNNVAPEERGSATGITGVAWNLPYSITSTFGGYIMANISLHLPFLVCGTLYAISTTLFYVFFRHFKPKREILGHLSSVWAKFQWVLMIKLTWSVDVPKKVAKIKKRYSHGITSTILEVIRLLSQQILYWTISMVTYIDDYVTQRTISCKGFRLETGPFFSIG